MTIIEIVLNTRAKSKGRSRKVRDPDIAQHVPIAAPYRSPLALKHAFAKRCDVVARKALDRFHCDVHQHV